MTNVLKQIADNLGVVGYDDSSLLIGIADYYGVNTTISNNLMGDILTAVGGDPAISNNYIQDIVIALGGPSTSLNWIEEWEIITATPPVPAPVNTVAPVISGTMVVGQTLTTTNGTWTNSPTSFTYKWYKGITAIVGATSSTYILVQADAGTTTAIKCEVTAINLGGSTAADSNTLTTVYDADAQAFITAAVITVLVQMTAINELTIGLKANNIWNSMSALYPFVGGTATQHKYNLKNPLDTNAAFRLVFNGGWTHSANGATPNGTNAYANTFFIPSAQQNVNSNGLGCYITQNSIGGDPIIMGAFNGTSQASLLNVSSLVVGTRLNGVIVSGVISGGFGSFDAQRTSSIITSVFKNGTFLNNGLSGGTLSSFSCYLGALNLNNFFYGPVNSQFRLAYLSEGLSNSEISNLRTSIQAFQTTLSRQV